MRCPECNVETPDAAAYCPTCGRRLGEAAEASDDGSPIDSPPATATERFAAAAGLPNDRCRFVPEEDVWRGGYSPRAMIGHWIAAGCVTLAVPLAVWIAWNTALGWRIGLAVVAVLWAALLMTLTVRRLSVHYHVTNHRLFHEHGLLHRVTDRIELIDIDDITVAQGLIERFTGVGSILITSSDRTTPQLWLRGIDRVRQVANTIDNARRHERLRRGLHIEQV
jgi:membrane protein YdbS with pleckstrin-like domain